MSHPPTPAQHPLAGPAAILAGLLAFCVYAWLALPTTYLLDSSEFVATTAGLGVSHPPGHPAYHLTTRLALLFPLGSAAVRVHLASAAASAVASGLMVAASTRWGWLRRRDQVLVAVIVSLLFATAPGVVFHAIRAEVYALQALVVAVLVWLLARPDGAPSVRECAVAGVVLGVGLLNHHYLAALFSPALIMALFVMNRTRPIRLVACAGAAVLASAAALPGYAYLLAVGATQAQSTWGWPAGMTDVWWFVSAEPFQRSFAEPTTVPLGERAAVLVALLMAQMGPAAFVAGALGAGLMLTRRTAPAMLVLGAIAFNLVSVVGREPQPENPDIAGYLIGSCWLIGLAAIYGVTVALEGLARSRRRRAAVAAAALALVGLAGGALLRGVPPAQGGGYRQSDALRRPLEHDAPPDALLALSYFETLFNAWYGRELEDVRPDVALVPRALLTHAPYRRDAGARLAAAASLGAGAEAVALAAGDGRVRLVEVERIVPQDELRCGVVDGFVLRVEPGCDAPIADDPACASSFERLAGTLPRPLEQQTARNVMWAGWNLANAMCATERPRCCAALVNAVLPLSPSDPDLLALAREARGALSAPASGASTPE